ncbi:MAG TPA: SAM-dependent methyltransferase, partial [Dehalococcoidia bacterium]|nr:SAM-dependent methyltransferase [Dehalococcoidia bacterium]
LEGLPEPVDFVTVDVSFISLRMVLPVVRGLLAPADGRLKPAPRNNVVVLFKPQFEAAKTEVPRGGVIRDSGLQAALIGRFAAWCVANGFRILDLVASPILGAEGNREFLLWLRPGAAEAGKPRLRGKKTRVPA